MNFRWIKALIFAVLSVMGIGLLSLAANAQLLDISVAKAPVAPDGTTAGAETDFVLTFEDRNPTVNGKSMFTNGTVTVELPDSFTRSVGLADTLILLQGWPQSPPAPFPWGTTVVGNTITATMTADYKIGDFGPGMKQVHLLLREFRNPGPGRYPVSLAIDPDGDGTPNHSGIGYVKIIPRARPSVNVVSFFSGPPGPADGPPPFFNPLYQTMSTGDLGAITPRQAGLYFWEADSIPALGVDLRMTNPNHGRLVQGRRTVGQVLIQAPAGANGYELTTTGASIAVNTGVTGRPTGLLIVRFVPDPNVKGDYAIDISMNGGNTERMFVTVN